MIIRTQKGLSFDTDKDLTAAERHLLQKLFIWEGMAESLDQFRREKEKALLSGWNKSGPVRERPALKAIISDLEEKLAKRLAEDTGASPKPVGVMHLQNDRKG